jgi:hypothetical protein
MGGRYLNAINFDAGVSNLAKGNGDGASNVVTQDELFTIPNYSDQAWAGKGKVVVTLAKAFS